MIRLAELCLLAVLMWAALALVLTGHPWNACLMLVVAFVWGVAVYAHGPRD